MTLEFVAAILEGIEGTLGAVVERIGPSDLRADLTSLLELVAEERGQVAAAAQEVPAAIDGLDGMELPSPSVDPADS